MAFLNKFNKNSKQKKSIFKRFLIIIIIIIMFFSILGLNEVFSILKINGKEIQITIPDGSPLNKVSGILYDNNLINNKTLFSSVVKVNGKSSKIKSGSFLLHKGMSYFEIIETIENSSKNIDKSDFVIPEGSNFFEINKIKDSFDNKKFTDLLEEINNPEIYKNYKFYTNLDESQVNSAFFPMEGFVYPNTFHVDSSTTSKELANIMFKSSDKKYDEILDQLKNTDMTYHDVITLASMIEAEAGNTEDMYKISSVFHNRINNSIDFPKLESDPTRVYAEQIKNNISLNKKTDFSVGDKYNTYICKGLPLGPICNPSIDAIYAAIKPLKTNYYYFCSNVNTRESYFSEDLSQHNENLKKAGINNR